MEIRTLLRTTVVLAAAAIALTRPVPATAGCGCAKPPPARAAIRPFVGYVDQTATLFDERLVPGETYDVQFLSTVDGGTDWSRGKAQSRRDLADGEMRSQLRVRVGDVALGPCRVSVWRGGRELYALGDDEFTVTSGPVALHDFKEAVTRDSYQAGVGKDGTVYLAVDVGRVSDATTFTGAADGFPLHFGATSVAIYNEQGFLMQLLDPSAPGLFRIRSGATMGSDALDYWRHEFRSYKEEHRKVDARRTDGDADWHVDGSYHVDHDHLVVAIAGTLAGGSRPTPGATPPFRLVVTSTPSPAL